MTMAAAAAGLLLTAVCLWGSTAGQVISRGACPSTPTQPDFDLTAYTGVWYEQAKFFALFEALQDCVKAQYTLNSDRSVTVVNSGVLRNDWFQRNVSIEGKATVPDPNDPAKLSVSFFGLPGSRVNYEVLETDYDSYALVFSCSSFYDFFNSQYAWLLVRERSGISDAKVQEIFSRLQEYGINTSKFASTDQTNCSN